MPIENLYNERELLRRVAEGEEMAFRQIYSLFLRLMGKAMFDLLKSEDAMRDVLQEAFLRIWLNRERLSKVDNPGGWIRRVITNECFRYMRKQGLRVKREVTYKMEHMESHTPADEAERGLGLMETRKLIQQAVSKLSSRQSIIYRLSREQYKKVPEIANELGLSEDYVKKTLATAVQRIRKHLTNAGKLLPLFII